MAFLAGLLGEGVAAGAVEGAVARGAASSALKGAGKSAVKQAARQATQRSLQRAVAVGARNPNVGMVQAAQTASRTAQLGGPLNKPLGSFRQLQAGVQAATRTQQYADLRGAAQALNGGRPTQRQPRQASGGGFSQPWAGGTSPTEGSFHGTSALYEPGRGFGRGGTTAETGSTFLRGGYKSFTGSEALTGVAQKSDYMPYEYGSGYRSDKLYQPGRGFQQQGSIYDMPTPAPNTRFPDQRAIEGPKVMGELTQGKPPIPQPPVPTARPMGEGTAAFKAPQFQYTQPSMF